jgi:predicted GIY-YIG superfamily endonuclease
MLYGKFHLNVKDYKLPESYKDMTTPSMFEIKLVKPRPLPKGPRGERAPHKPADGHFTLYEIECLDDYTYVGFTGNYETRMVQQREGTGAHFIREHGFKRATPIKTYESVDKVKVATQKYAACLRAQGLKVFAIGDQ